MMSHREFIQRTQKIQIKAKHSMCISNFLNESATVYMTCYVFSYRVLTVLPPLSSVLRLPQLVAIGACCSAKTTASALHRCSCRNRNEESR